MIFVDSNVPIYLVGAGHPDKVRVSELLARFIRDNERLVTDVEVYQEVRYAHSVKCANAVLVFRTPPLPLQRRLRRCAVFSCHK